MKSSSFRPNPSEKVTQVGIVIVWLAGVMFRDLSDHNKNVNKTLTVLGALVARMCFLFCDMFVLQCNTIEM